MTAPNSGIASQSRAYFDSWAVTLTDESLRTEFRTTLQQLLAQSNDRVILRLQSLYRELTFRKIPATFSTYSVQSLPFEGISTLLTYAAQCVRDWELLNKGAVTQAADEIDSLGAWHFNNDTALKSLAE
jgi:hypothetical protein